MKKYFAVVLFLFIAQQAGACVKTLYFDPITARNLEAIIEIARGVGAAVIPQKDADNGHRMFAVIDRELATQARGLENECGEGTRSADYPVPVSFPVYLNPSDRAKVILFISYGACHPQGGFTVNYPNAAAHTEGPDGMRIAVMPKEMRNERLNCEIIQALLAQK